MKFSEFLLSEGAERGDYKKIIDLDEAVDIFIKYCNNMDVNSPYYRANAKKDKYMVLHGELGERVGTTSVNYHNVVLDYQIKQMGDGTPLRSKSIIGIGNNGGDDVVGMYGKNLYMLYPYNDVPIMRCSANDILYMKSGGRYITDSTDHIEMIINKLRVSSFSELVDLLHNAEYPVHSKIKADLDGKSKEEIEKYLIKIFDIKEFTKIDNAVDNKNKHEIWVGGKCLAVHIDNKDDFLKAVSDRLK